MWNEEKKKERCTHVLRTWYRKIKVYHRLAVFSMLLAVLCFLGGCQDRDTKTETVLGEDQYLVYYLSSPDSYELVSTVFQTEEKQPLELAKQLFQEFRNLPDNRWSSILDNNVFMNDMRLEEGVLLLDMSDTYTQLSSIREILCRTAIVWTLSQVPEISYVQITVAGNPLTDSTGNQVGAMRPEDFENEIGGGIGYTSLTLYFTDETGTMLVEEEREVAYRNGLSLERIIVEQLIDGPEIEGAYPILPSDVELTNVNVVDGVCYLYFNSAFLKNSLAVRDVIPIYGIVNSLVEMNHITKVQFVINNSFEAVFRGTLLLSGTFERNLDLIKED